MALSTADAQGPVQIGQRAEEVQGQAQGPTSPPRHDGKHFVHEVMALTDRVITDIKDKLAVQIPEGVGASTYGHRSPMGEALATGTPEAQFAKAEDRLDKDADQNAVQVTYEQDGDAKADAAAKMTDEPVTKKS